MASSPKKLKIEANGFRLSKLLINKGTQALKTTLQFNINFRSSNLRDELNKPSNKSKLESLRKRNVINKEQWNLLYPSTGLPNLENFDISLLTVLLRNICGLTAPPGGWDNPSSSDSSISANIARIKFYRNKVYGHVATTSLNDSEFEYLWQEISKALVGLGIQQTEIDELKNAPLSPDEANYIKILKNWCTVAVKTKEDVEVIKADVAEITQVMATKAVVAEITQVMAAKADVVRVREMIQDKIFSDLQKLRKCKFDGLIKDHNKKYLKGTRQWLFEKLDTWFNDRSEDASNVMILIAGPGVGKSVFAAEVCRRYSEKKKLAASHFCRYNRSDYRNPRMLIESLASSMCDTISNFKSKLNEELQRNHSKESIADAFLVLLNNPLHSLEDHEPMLLVIDALDESQVDGKSELLELIAEEFDRMPKWIKIFITSRPELPLQKKLKDMNPVEITTCPGDENNEEDLHKYLRHQLNDQVQRDPYLLRSLVKKCEGSFLYAYYAQLSLKKEEIELTDENIEQLVASGLSSVYTKQFKTVKKWLTEKSLSTGNSVISEVIFMQFLEFLAACPEFLPLTLVFSYLGFSDDIKFEVRSEIIELLSPILSVYNDFLTVYHKSLIDWLKSDGYEQHEFTVDPKYGHKFLWRVCEKVFEQIKRRNISEDQMNTAMINYALKNGIYHMLKCDENVDFSGAEVVKVVGARLKSVEDNDMHTISSELPSGGSKPATPTQSSVSKTPPIPTPSQSTSSRVPSERTNNDRKQPPAVPFIPVCTPNTPLDPPKTPPASTKTLLVPPRTPPDPTKTLLVSPRAPPDPFRTPTFPPRTQLVSPMPPQRENDSKLEETLKGLTLKRDQYKLAARNCNRSGDKENAKKYLIISKDFDAVIQAVKDGKDVDLTQCPPPPPGFPGFDLKSQFLDKHYNIKNDVHEKFKSILWICGNYGTVRKNKVIPYPHMYITVDDVEGRSDEDLKKEIDKVFQWEASKFIEIRRKPYKKPKIRYLSNFRAVQNNDTPNPMQRPNGFVMANQSASGSRGTMTMFCGKNNRYYALTCAHVACGASDMVGSALAFNQKKNFSAIRDAVKHLNEGTAYFYKLLKPKKEVKLPSFPNGVVGHFDGEVDIVRIFIGDKRCFQCLGGDDMECFVLNLDQANEELYERIENGYESVKVRTDYHNIGFISELRGCHLTKSSNEIEREILFRNAVKVKSNCQFLKKSDSGVLVYFFGEQENWQPFSYGVCDIDDDDDDDGEGGCGDGGNINDDDGGDGGNDDDDVGDDGNDDGGDDGNDDDGGDDGNDDDGGDGGDDDDGGDDGNDDGGDGGNDDDNGGDDGNDDDGDDDGDEGNGGNIDDDDGGDGDSDIESDGCGFDGDIEGDGVGDGDDDNVIFEGSRMKTFLCLKLDKALTAVELDNCNYFRSEV